MTTEQFTKISEILKVKHQALIKPIIIHTEGPIIFLLDENHSSPDVIRDNIQIVGTLIQDSGVAMIAVEGIEGDRLTRRDLKCPDPVRCFGVSHFGEQMALDTRVEVVGVDSRRLFKEIERDCEARGLPAATHPAQELRSAHMLESLLQKLKARPAVLAAVLNGGTRHNDDIERSLRATLSRKGAAVIASFIRIRSKLYLLT